ncbi:UDP-glycosyltransferase [Salinimicrobium sp. MT39]|uniref:UDP-glycosyltransferase n=1 Tax=Salinimicrobium profundisediminis TaxID=2994553 RepID=A0A9X3CVI2_9FLAO|nr:UDP-glycosyltransferase [Salinimicrobium profundisediminis]MCX2837493.1 UDP-glycosyltransferase [Salinimicrobium profundisediminis]
MKKTLVKKILVVAESIDVEDSSGTKGRVALIKNLSRAGFHVVVYHYTRQEIQLPGIRCVALNEDRKSILFFLSRLERHLRKKIGINLNPYIERWLGFSLTFLNDRNSITGGLRKIKDIDPDMVLTLSKGASFRPHYAMLNFQQWHDKWMAYIHDPYPFASYPRPYDYVEPGHQQKRKFFLKIASKAKYACYPSTLLAEWMESYYLPLKGKRIIIPHQIVEEKINTTELPKFFLQEAFTIVHAGALMGARNPMGLIEAFKRFVKEVPEAAANSQLLFLGPESRYTEEFAKIKKGVPQFYSSDGNLPFEQVQTLQNRAAVNVILEAKGPISPFLPGKFPHCIQARKPILLLGPYYSESRRLLGNDYPWWSEIDDEERIKLNISKLYKSWLQNKSSLSEGYGELLNYLSVMHLKRVIKKIGNYDFT